MKSKLTSSLFALLGLSIASAANAKVPQSKKLPAGSITDSDIVAAMIVDGTLQLNEDGTLTPSKEIQASLETSGLIDGNERVESDSFYGISKEKISPELREQMMLDSLKRKMDPDNFEEFLRKRKELQNVKSMSFSGPA